MALMIHFFHFTPERVYEMDSDQFHFWCDRLQNLFDVKYKGNNER